MGAGMLSIITCTLPSVVGKGIPDATWVPEARLTPYSVSNSPGARPAVKGAELPAFPPHGGFRNAPVLLKPVLMVGACSATLSPRYGPIPLPIRIPLPTTKFMAGLLYAPFDGTV